MIKQIKTGTSRWLLVTMVYCVLVIIANDLHEYMSVIQYHYEDPFYTIPEVTIITLLLVDGIGFAGNIVTSVFCSALMALVMEHLGRQFSKFAGVLVGLALGLATALLWYLLEGSAHVLRPYYWYEEIIAVPACIWLACKFDCEIRHRI